jgi:hypothetical protein
MQNGDSLDDFFISDPAPSIDLHPIILFAISLLYDACTDPNCNKKLFRNEYFVFHGISIFQKVV